MWAFVLNKVFYLENWEITEIKLSHNMKYVLLIKKSCLQNGSGSGGSRGTPPLPSPWTNVTVASSLVVHDKILDKICYKGSHFVATYS